MTISNTTTRVAYDGNGATIAFAVPFPFFAPSELEVIQRNIALGSETVMTLGAEYSVTGGDGATGTVSASVAPASGTQWVIRRKTARTQATDYTPNDPFPAETHEKALDRLTMISQELSETADRALKFPRTDAAALSSTMPSSVDRSGKVLAFDASGSPAVSNLTLANLEAQPVAAAASAASAASSANAAQASATTAAGSATAAQAAQSAAESAAAGMKWRPSVRAASTANVNLANAPASLDGVTCAIGDRWLLKDQTTAAQNGVYVFNGAGVALTRAADADTWAELVSQCVAVEQGTVNADFTYICTVDQGGTLGTTAVTWASFKILAGSITGTLPISSGGTGDTGSAWTAFTPGVSASAGTFGSISASGFQKTIGKTTFVQVNVIVTTIGTATGNINVSLPSNAAHDTYFAAGEHNVAGSKGMGLVLAGSNLAAISRYDNASMIAANAIITMSGVYESQ